MPLLAHVPMSPPTAKRMKIALMPVDTLSAEALPRAGSECPRRLVRPFHEGGPRVDPYPGYPSKIAAVA
jgi:hypothetical protein